MTGPSKKKAVAEAPQAPSVPVLAGYSKTIVLSKFRLFCFSALAVVNKNFLKTKHTKQNAF